jgi:uncharacterized protein with von Willebrand factor type A (vWA) domain
MNFVDASKSMQKIWKVWSYYHSALEQKRNNYFTEPDEAQVFFHFCGCSGEEATKILKRRPKTAQAFQRIKNRLAQIGPELAEIQKDLDYLITSSGKF